MNKRLAVTLLTGIGIALLPLLGLGDSQTQSVKDIELNKKMASLGQAISNLFPLAIDETQLNTPAMQKVLSVNIDALVKTVPLVKPHFSRKSLTYQLSFDIIQRHTEDLKTAFDNQRYNHVKSMLRATASICVSCHSQDKNRRTVFVGFSRNKFQSDYSFAEYNYITRNYDQAEKYYLRYLKNPGKHNIESDQLNALRHILSIYTQILNNVDKGITILNKIKKNKHLTTYARKQVTLWLAGLNEIAKLSHHQDDVDFAHISDLVDNYIKASDRPVKLEYLYWIRGLTYRYLSASPDKSEIPSLLYWLALTERGTNQSVYFSLGDLYLKQCMLIYPNYPVAKKCYDEYEDAVVFAYSGSRGTDIPDDIQESMKELKALVYPNTVPKEDN